MKALKTIWSIYVTACTVLVTWLLMLWIINGGYIGCNGKRIHYEGLLKTNKLDTVTIEK